MRLNNKGFTLIELLGVLVVLVAILLIAIPNIISTFERNKEKNNEQKIENIKSAGEIYASKYKKELGDNYNNFLNGSCCITIEEIMTKELLTSDELKNSQGVDLYEITAMVCYDKTNGIYNIDTSGKTSCV